MLGAISSQTDSIAKGRVAGRDAARAGTGRNAKGPSHFVLVVRPSVEGEDKRSFICKTMGIVKGLTIFTTN
jgi:hypothetical protein